MSKDKIYIHWPNTEEHSTAQHKHVKLQEPDTNISSPAKSWWQCRRSCTRQWSESYGATAATDACNHKSNSCRRRIITQRLQCKVPNIKQRDQCHSNVYISKVNCSRRIITQCLQCKVPNIRQRDQCYCNKSELQQSTTLAMQSTKDQTTKTSASLLLQQKWLSLTVTIRTAYQHRKPSA